MGNITHELIRPNAMKIRRIIETLVYKKGWDFALTDDVPTKFSISLETEDSLKRWPTTSDADRHELPYEYTRDLYIMPSSEPFWVRHVFDIPPYDLSVEELERYILDRIMDIDRHEAMEAFKINGVAPFFPDHSDVSKLYSIHRREA